MKKGGDGAQFIAAKIITAFSNRIIEVLYEAIEKHGKEGSVAMASTMRSTPGPNPNQLNPKRRPMTLHLPIVCYNCSLWSSCSEPQVVKGHFARAEWSTLTLRN